MDLENIGSVVHVVLYIAFYMQSCSHAVSLPTQAWSGKFVSAEGTRGMDACSGPEAFCRGEEDGLLSVEKVTFIGGTCHRYIHISEGVRNMKEYESASFYGCYMTFCPWLRFGRKMKGYGP